MRCASLPIVVYVIDQSTDSPSVRHSDSNTRSSSSVSCRHSSTKFGREIDTGSVSDGSDGGSKLSS